MLFFSHHNNLLMRRPLYSLAPSNNNNSHKTTSYMLMELHLAVCGVFPQIQRSLSGLVASLKGQFRRITWNWSRNSDAQSPKPVKAIKRLTECVPQVPICTISSTGFSRSPASISPNIICVQIPWEKTFKNTERLSSVLRCLGEQRLRHCLETLANADHTRY